MASPGPITVVGGLVKNTGWSGIICRSEASNPDRENSTA